VCIFSSGYFLGFRKNIRNTFSAEKVSLDTPDENGAYTVILSGRWLYVYGATGALCDTVYVFPEDMAEEDKNALSNGAEFENKEEMERAFTEMGIRS
jgi:hypothetical protein